MIYIYTDTDTDTDVLSSLSDTPYLADLDTSLPVERHSHARPNDTPLTRCSTTPNQVLDKYTALVLRPAYATHAPPRAPDYRPQTGLLLTRLTLALDRVVEPAVRRGLERAA